MRNLGVSSEYIISMLWETGAKMGEIMYLTPKDIDDYSPRIPGRDKRENRIHKTPLITTGPYLSLWLENHHLKDTQEWPDVPLWWGEINGTENREKRK